MMTATSEDVRVCQAGRAQLSPYPSRGHIIMLICDGNTLIF